MQRIQAFKYELRPNGHQERQMRRFAGSCRFVYNKALAVQKERDERGEKRPGYVGLCKQLTEWRNSEETAWLADGSSFTPLNSFKRHETRLRKAQQAMSRKVKFSNNWKKVREKVQRIHVRIGHVRRDFLHKPARRGARHVAALRRAARRRSQHGDGFVILSGAPEIELGLIDLDQWSNAPSPHAGEHLLMLINEILDLAKIEAGRLTLWPRGGGGLG